MRGRRRSPAERHGPAGVGAAHPDHRGFRSGGGFRRSGQSKPSSYKALPPPPPPPLPPPPPPLPRRPSLRRTDVILEAGRLAAEYLVAKGLLPASSLPPSTAARWGPTGGGEEVERASALSRLGRRRFEEEDDDGVFGERKRARRRRNRSGPYGRRGSEWERENGRGGPWTETSAERARGVGYSDVMDDEDLDRPGRGSGRDKESVYTVEDEDLDRQERSEDSSFGDGGGGRREPLKVATTDELNLPPKGEVTGGSELELENHSSANETGAKTMQEIEDKTNPGPETLSDDIRVSDLGEEEEKSKNSTEFNPENVLQMGEEEDLAVMSCPAMEDNQVGNHGVSLLSGFVKAPTKPRSSGTNRNPRAGQKPSAENGREISDATLEGGGLKNKAEEVSTVAHLNDAPTDQFQTSRGPASAISTLSTFSDSCIMQPQNPRGIMPEVSTSQSTRLVESVQCCLISGAESIGCSGSHSFPESSSLTHVHQETSEGSPGLELPRASLDNDDAKMDEIPAEHMERERTKQPQEWSPSCLKKMDEYFCSSRTKQSDNKLSEDHDMADAREQNRADDFPKAVEMSVSHLEEQRQLASTSFKICDLNLVEAPEVTDIPKGPVLEHVSTLSVPPETENNPSASFDLSICQRQNETESTDSQPLLSRGDKVAPVIDLEDDSPLEVDARDTSRTMSEPIYPNLENFLNHPENPVSLPNIQDGFGLAISEFLGNDIAGCPAVQGDIGDLQTFHGAQGIAGNDDSLYVTLGEIPLNFMEVWDQPPPEYEKFF